jgi:hypothetical protein
MENASKNRSICFQAELFFNDIKTKREKRPEIPYGRVTAIGEKGVKLDDRPWRSQISSARTADLSVINKQISFGGRFLH